MREMRWVGEECKKYKCSNVDLRVELLYIRTKVGQYCLIDDACLAATNSGSRNRHSEAGVQTNGPHRSKNRPAQITIHK